MSLQDRRLAADGTAYTYLEFVQWYGAHAGQMWVTGMAARNGRRVVEEHWDALRGFLFDGQSLTALAELGRLTLAMRMLEEVRVLERDFSRRWKALVAQDELDREIMLEGAIFDSELDAHSDVASVGFSIDSDGHWHEHGNPWD